MKVPPSSKDVSRSIAARLDRLPVTGLTWRIVILGSLAWAIESLSIGSTGVVLPLLKSVWHLSTSAIGWLAVSSTLGIVVGLIPAGRLADRFGRKPVLFWGIIEYSVLTMLSAASPDVGWLLALRGLAGLGMGAVFPLPYAFTSEFVPTRRRTVFNGIMDSSLSAGYFIAPVLGLILLPDWPAATAWRIFFVISGLPVLFAFIIRRYLPESPRWLSRSGQPERALAIVSQLERRAHQPGSDPDSATAAPSDPLAISPHQNLGGGIVSPWRRPLRRQTVVLAIAAVGTFFMFYIVMTYLPLVFSQQGYRYATSLGFTALITAAAIPGKLLNGLLGETVGRKWMYVLFMGLAGLAAIGFGAAASLPLMLLAGGAMSFFGTGAFPVLKMAYAEQYPTPLRTTGAATVETVGRFFGGIVGSYGFPAILARVGLTSAFDWVAVVALAAVVVTIAYGRESKQASLEDLEARLS